MRKQKPTNTFFEMTKNNLLKWCENNTRLYRRANTFEQMKNNIFDVKQNNSIIGDYRDIKDILQGGEKQTF